MTPGALHVAMITPSATGGHPLYTWEMMTALRAAAPRSQLRLTLVTSCDLDEQYRDTDYDIADVLPALRHRSTYWCKAAWATGRIVHYARRERTVLRWLRERGNVDIAHFQEQPLVAPMVYARVRRACVLPMATVHNLAPHRYPI